MPEQSRLGALAATALVVVTLDQASKAAVVSAMQSHGRSWRLDLAGDWLALDYTENRGVAFGFLATAGSWLTAVPLIVLIGLVGYSLLARKVSRWEALAVGAIVGGAVGNLVDRLRLGYVVDYISVGVWPNFNIADSAITLGVILLLCGWFIPSGERSDGSAAGREVDGHGVGSRPEQQRVRS